MAKRAPKLVHDPMCPWPYSVPYGMVPAPKPPRTPRKRKPRTTKRAIAQWGAVTRGVNT
jgi:hypothetical protein